MRIVMMGTGQFAVPTFQWLLQSTHDVPALVTRPSREVHTRGKPMPNPMRDVAAAVKLPVLAPESINMPAVREQLAELAADLFVVCDYGQILKAETLAAAPLGGINLHASLLPKYRGAAPVNWALYHDERETGVTVIHMTPRLDAGPTLATRALEIDPQETALQLEARLAQLGIEAVREAIDLLTERRAEVLAGQTIGRVQDNATATRAPRLSKADGAIDWSRTARQIVNQLRAMQPWPGCYTHWLRGGGDPLRLIITAASVVEEEDLAPSGAAPGEVVSSDHGALVVNTGAGLLSLEQVQPAGKRPMPAAQFLRGYPVGPGERLGVPK